MSCVWRLLVATGLMVVAVSGQQDCAGQEQCVSIRECPDKLSLLRQIQAKTAPPGSFASLRRSICGFSNFLPRVCCVTDDKPNILINENTPSPPGGGLGEGVLPSVCGINTIFHRDIRGPDAAFNAWPWMTVISSRRHGGSTFTCGGVLISERYVLTAAHCIRTVDAGVIEFVRVGEHNTAQNPDCMHGVCAPSHQDITVEEIRVHEEYASPCPRCNDIALLRLSRPATLNYLTVWPICLPRNLTSELGFNGNDFTGRYAWVTGWNTVHREDVVRPDVLQQARLPLGNKYCDLSQYPDPNMVFCAGGEDSTCRGDSGSPLVVYNVHKTVVFVLGITIAGPAICGASFTQSIYTNVHYYRPWILSNMRN